MPTATFNTDTLSLGSVGAKATGSQSRLIGRTSGAPSTGTWAQGDIAPDAAGSIWLCVTAGTPGIWVRIGRTTVFDIRDYGAVIDGSTDDTAAWTAAIAAAAAVQTQGVKFQNGSGTFQAGTQANGAGIVFHPGGVSEVSNITLLHRVQTTSVGAGGIVRQKVGSTGPVITNKFDGTAHAKYCGVFDMAITSEVTSGSTNHGISWVGDQTFTYNSTLDEDWDANNVTSNVYIWNIPGDGIHTVGSGENRISNFKIRSVKGNGLYVDYDNYVTHGTVGHCGLRGVVVAGDSNRFSNVKSWYTGEVTVASGQGWLLQGDSGTMADCSAQDCNAQGLLLDGAFGWFVNGFEADSNSKTGAGTYAQVDVFNSENNKVEASCRNRFNAGGPGTIALNIGGTSKQNKIEIEPGTGVWGTTTLLKSGSTVSGNEVVFGAVAEGWEEIAYAATVTLNPLLGRKKRIANLTGAMLLANPTWKWDGCELLVRIKQDATGGHAVTYDADFDTTGATASTSANAVTVQRWIYSGVSTKWEIW